ncbi:biotin-independent malonate decarboxylase subunit beta [Acinetobacter silvestris]|uniref:Biotin-independent malonate decarboxylase subunit beta n=1 Tax=Acinetobacter silvestris TaxID=1977882 RepID=A0A1Y3CJC2_9GAMM|nr:biotin-independent malonate decarboxylase subunit beta [Acinetobacter silvestris]
MAKKSFIELSARERAKALLDEQSFRELLDPFAQMMSPWLPKQNIVPQADDGVVVAKGTLQQKPVVIISIEGNFQGGSLGEVGGAKIAGALELAVEDNLKGIPTAAILLLETGGVRLQEANLGLAAIAEIQAAIVALRQYQPVIGVIAGSVGCFGGMSIAAALCSYLIMTQEGRLGLNGPQVIEQEAGVQEYDSKDRPFIWSITGGQQRFASGLVDAYVEDDCQQIQQQVLQYLIQGQPELHRSSNYDFYLNHLQAVDTTVQATPASSLDFISRRTSMNMDVHAVKTSTRGQNWFKALTADFVQIKDAVESVWIADGQISGKTVRVIAVVPHQHNLYPRAQSGEVGLLEGWTLAKVVDDVIQADLDRDHKRAILCIVDVPSQAYGRREELFGIHQALAGAVDSYARARLAGHPIISLLVGKSMSGAFLAHGYQANRIIALKDTGVMVHAMGKESAARVTLRTVDELEKLAANIPPMAYDIESYATLGLLSDLLTVVSPEQPTIEDIASVQNAFLHALNDIQVIGSTGLEHRLHGENRQASKKVRELLREQWYAD